jgi:hypothetical protein
MSNEEKIDSETVEPAEIEEKVGVSGYPFQKEIEKLILSNQCDYYPHQIEVPLSVPPEYASKDFIPPSLDIALCYAEHPSKYPPKWSVDLLVECKKAYEKDWYFFSKLGGSYYKNNRFPISAATYYPGKPGDIFREREPRIRTIFFDCNMIDSPIEPPICDNVLEVKTKNSTSKNDREVVYRACGTLSVALVHFLNLAKMSMIHLSQHGGNPDNVTMAFPIIVTTAKLHIIDSKELSVDLTSGRVDKTTIKHKEVDWVLFEFPLFPSLQKSEPVYALYDSAKELATKMGCLIVRGDKLIPFLSRFNTNLLMKVAKSFSEEEKYVTGRKTIRIKRDMDTK